MAEILAPAGSPAQLTAAVNAGADAVYMGAPGFNARAYATGFTPEQAARYVEFAHKNGVKVYVALNTLVTDKEMQSALETAYYMQESGADAFIVQDAGLARLMARSIKGVQLHASTQMSVLNADHALRLKDMGYSRVILGRELSVKEIAAIKEQTGMEIEVFVHGSLCMCISGQCYFSSVLGGRSGNRGRCAQQCRQIYMVDGKWGTPLSLKDLYSGDHIKELESAGVDSFKIEGRMKRPEYVYEAVKAYRQKDFSPQSVERLKSLFSRQGFTDGYLKGTVDKSMIGYRQQGQKEDSIAAARDIDITVVQENRAPILPPKTQITPLNYTAKRQNPKAEKPRLYLTFEKAETIPHDIGKYNIDKIFVAFDALDDRADFNKIGAQLPFPVFEKDREKYLAKLENLAKAGLKTALCSTPAQIEDAKKLGVTPIADFRCNIFNNSSLMAYKGMGIGGAVLSFELSFPQIRDIIKTVDCGIVAYGRLPLMVTRSCMVKNGGRCGDCDGGFTLTNENRRQFPVIRNFECSNTILNSHPLYVGDMKDISAMGLKFLLLRFTTESPAVVKRVLDDFTAGRPPKGDFTRGLYTKGVL